MQRNKRLGAILTARAEFKGPVKPFYHFDLANWKAIVDAGGADLADDVEAMNSADVVARRLLERMPQLRNQHYAVLVTDAEGDEVCRLPLDVVH